MLRYAGDFLRDLAGNAFHSGCCAGVMLSIMLTFGLALKRSAGCKVHAVRNNIKLFRNVALIDEAGDDLDDLWM